MFAGVRIQSSLLPYAEVLSRLGINAVDHSARPKRACALSRIAAVRFGPTPRGLGEHAGGAHTYTAFLWSIFYRLTRDREGDERHDCGAKHTLESAKARLSASRAERVVGAAVFRLFLSIFPRACVTSAAYRGLSPCLSSSTRRLGRRIVCRLRPRCRSSRVEWSKPVS